MVRPNEAIRRTGIVARGTIIVRSRPKNAKITTITYKIAMPREINFMDGIHSCKRRYRMNVQFSFPQAIEIEYYAKID